VFTYISCPFERVVKLRSLSAFSLFVSVVSSHFGDDD